MNLLGNLDCEARWAGVALPEPVLQRISLYAALFAACAPEPESTPADRDRNHRDPDHHDPDHRDHTERAPAVGDSDGDQAAHDLAGRA